MQKYLVSILIPAYNAEETIAETLQSAVGQTWPHKEIIVVDDGSTDRTAEVAARFEDRVTCVTVKNQGAASTRNHALNLSSGDYIQWLDADDLLSPNKIELQLARLEEGSRGRTLLSSGWGYFYYRAQCARCAPTALYADLSPLEWLLKKMSENLHMQTATWLTSRELAQAAGPWNTSLLSDDDGEYFCRVLLASEGTRFVPDARVYYRASPSNRLSFIGTSGKKMDAMLVSMKLHVRYLRSLEESERVWRACLTYIQNWYPTFYPERPDIVAELQSMAKELGGSLHEPRLRWKYRWMKPLFGWHAAKQAQMTLPQVRASWARAWDKAMYRIESRGGSKRKTVPA